MTPCARPLLEQLRWPGRVLFQSLDDALPTDHRRSGLKRRKPGVHCNEMDTPLWRKAEARNPHPSHATSLPAASEKRTPAYMPA